MSPQVDRSRGSGAPAAAAAARRRRGWLVRRALAAADVFGLAAAFLIADLIVGPAAPSPDRVGTGREYLLFLSTLPAWIVVAKLYGLYDRDEERTDHSTTDDFAGVFHMVTVGAWAFFALTQLTHLPESTLKRISLFWFLAIVSVTGGRAVARSLARRHPAYLQRAVIVGGGSVGQHIARKLLRHPEYGIEPIGFIDDAPKERAEDLGDLTLLGGRAQLEALVESLDVARVIVAFSNDSSEETLELLRSLRSLEVQVDVVPRFFDILGPGIDVHAVEGLPLIGLRPPRLSRSSALLKRSVDFVAASLALTLLAPLFLAIGIAIRLESEGPIFFRQVRMGRGDRQFRIWKFRTMANDADGRKHELAHLNKHAVNGGDPRMFKIPNDPRVTRVGRFLRRTSLDELPQLLNVIRGEMSLVGPRPLILEEDQFVASWARARLDIQPGITGLWQVLGRSAIPFEEMVRLDYLYVTTWSLWRDFRLIAQTIPALVRSGDA